MPTRSLCFRSNSSSAIGLEPLAREMIGSLHHWERIPEMERKLPSCCYNALSECADSDKDYRKQMHNLRAGGERTVRVLCQVTLHDLHYARHVTDHAHCVLNELWDFVFTLPLEFSQAR